MTHSRATPRSARTLQASIRYLNPFFSTRRPDDLIRMTPSERLRLASGDAAVRASCVEFVLAGLYAADRISRAQEHGRIVYEM